ncbi:hypothetical protein THAOC_31537, partial [Thalassiosira oceanica]
GFELGRLEGEAEPHGEAPDAAGRQGGTARGGRRRPVGRRDTARRGGRGDRLRLGRGLDMRIPWG